MWSKYVTKMKKKIKEHVKNDKSMFSGLKFLVTLQKRTVGTIGRRE